VDDPKVILEAVRVLKNTDLQDSINVLGNIAPFCRGID
jgi:hypothetical protein